VEYSEHDDRAGFDREIDRIRKAPKQRTADTGIEVLIAEGLCRDAVVGGAKYVASTSRSTPGAVTKW
jgi:hypothetical protein